MPRDTTDAFPTVDPRMPGMSLRDYFAAAAASGLLAAGYGTRIGAGELTERDLASDAYGIADAMLAEREGVR